jgi:membrane protein implicated in regulation of membrane protease activity
MAAVLSGVAASTVWRSPDESVALTGVTAVLVVALAAGWVAALRGDVLDAAFGSIWLAMTAPAPAALAMLLVVRRRVRRESGSPPR